MIAMEPEDVMNRRDGSVLGKKTILKSDHFPGCQNKKLTLQIDGAPNYRQVGHVHGVAIPTIDGIRNILNYIGSKKKGKQTRLIWHSLREEPVVYINGRPFVLRDVQKPFNNLEYTGINRARIEQMESRLKEDILLESARYGNTILLTDELPNGQMVDEWEAITEKTVKTSLEVYQEIQLEGYLVDYERIPVTDEKAPKEKDFDILVNRISQADIDTEFIFNCQMGRGRTTTGMVIATLVYLNRTGVSGIPRTNSVGQVSDFGDQVADVLTNSEEARRGEYPVIRSLIRALEGGIEGKKQVDLVIDKCATMQNLRESIVTYGSSILRQPDEKKREASLCVFCEYLERYYFLICFAVYIHNEIPASQSSPNQVSFSDWMKARPELYSILRRLLRRDPMGALGYSSIKYSLTKTDHGRPCEIDIVVATRKGDVLGKKTVLKSDHFPGCQALSLPEKVEGAPNFRGVPGFPVYGVANPTVDGIKNVVRKISDSRNGCPILWHNMREEPVIYINGKPFVLREVERPYKNMLEYSGIDCERVEKMEARLKDDILREACQYEGSIMVINETENNEIVEVWEHVDSEAVQTPLEVYKHLEAEGFPIKYARVPITDGKAPKSSDFDRMAVNICSASKDAAFVFNCQMGRGRTTTGTVIACLLKHRIDYGRPFKMVDKDVFLGNLEESSSDDEDILDSPTSKKTPPAFGIHDILLLRKITRMFDNGVECREVLDAVIDKCSVLQNIREAVLHYRRQLKQQHVEPRVKRFVLNRGAEYLERYLRLIAFSAYLGSEAFDGFCGQGESAIAFKTWLHQRPDLQATKWSVRLRPGRFFTDPGSNPRVHVFEHDDIITEAVVKARNGSVLGKGSILKMYFFPGQRTSDSMHIIGAPHVYKADSYPVYSMSTPTIDGAKEMLSHLGANSTENERTSPKVIVTDLREEAVVYVNGTPFVLRELDQPVDTLKHVGIIGEMVENMEARMKDDILSEIKQSGGRILLHREEFNPVSEHSTVIGYWENVPEDGVKTPAEVYNNLKDEGYNCQYRRIPLTREREALARDVEAIQRCKDLSAGCYLFVSHTGFGGVGYAMAITCLGLNAADRNLMAKTSSGKSSGTDDFSSVAVHSESPSSQFSDDEALKQGEYRDILNLTRVLLHGPKSKVDVDAVLERCSGAGNIRHDILHYKKKFEKCGTGDDETRSTLLDMGIKALRRYFLLITFRSYLFSANPLEIGFASWMKARPELRHLCDNLRFDR